MAPAYLRIPTLGFPLVSCTNSFAKFYTGSKGDEVQSAVLGIGMVPSIGLNVGTAAFIHNVSAARWRPLTKHSAGRVTRM